MDEEVDPGAWMDFGRWTLDEDGFWMKKEEISPVRADGFWMKKEDIG